MAEVVFWVLVSLAAYTWVGYPLALEALHRLARARRRSPDGTRPALPSITVVIPVRNGEKNLAAKLDNTLTLDYPAGRLDVVVASDGSTDRTAEIARRYAARGVRLWEAPRWIGKSAVQNTVIPRARGDVVVLTDLDARLDRGFARAIAGKFADPRVGCVTGELAWDEEDPSAGTVGRSGGIYWALEARMRRAQSAIGCLATASGACMAIRRDLFRPMKPYVGDDCVIPLDMALQGYRTVVASEARASDVWASTIESEFRARVRMTERNLTGTLLFWRLLNPLRHPVLSWSIASHKLLRWLTPYFAAGALIANLFLLTRPFYVATFALQAGGIAIAAIGVAAEKRGWRVPLAGALGSLLVVNIAFMIGVAQSALGRHSTGYRTTTAARRDAAEG